LEKLVGRSTTIPFELSEFVVLIFFPSLDPLVWHNDENGVLAYPCAVRNISIDGQERQFIAF
jgi:hypothetical protein